MSKPVIFISCGQFTTVEKALGKNIYNMVESLGMQPFFAEEVQDLKGLNENILNSLRDCAGFITVLHPRGKIIRPDGTEHVRASVWIEQEIGIAAYIMHVEKRQIPVIAFIHKSVGLEGIRTLLHLNPVTFSDEMEILAKLPSRLQAWGTLEPTGITLLINTNVPIPVLIKTDFPHKTQKEHLFSRLVFSLINNTNYRISEVSGTVKVSVGILNHSYHQQGVDNEYGPDAQYRLFRFDTRLSPIEPHTTAYLADIEYCISCMEGEFESEGEVEMKFWVNGREYRTLKTMKELLRGWKFPFSQDLNTLE